MALKLEIVTLYGTICYPLSLGAPYMPGLPIRCAQHSPRCPLSWRPLTQPAQCNPTTCPLSPDQGVHSMRTSVALVTMRPNASSSKDQRMKRKLSQSTSCTLYSISQIYSVTHITVRNNYKCKLCNRWLCKYGEAHEPPRSCNHNDLPSIMVRLLVSCQAINRPILVVVISCDKARSPAIGNGRPMGLTNYVSRNLQIKTVIKLYVMCMW